MKENIRKILVIAGAALFFLALSYSFVPQVLGGKIVNQGDIYGYVGMSHEMNQHNAANPHDPTAWTNSMFGGMPTTVISAPHRGDWTQPLYNLLLTGKRPATYIFISLLGAFLLMLSFGVSPLIAVIGAVAISFCSYNFQIIQVGHNTKMQAIAFLPWVLAALIYTYNSAVSKAVVSWKDWLPKTVLGSVLFAFALSFQVKANHQQITYYLGLLILLYVLVLLASLLIYNKAVLGRFVAASALLLAVGGLGIATNTIKLAPVWEYTEYSTRGGSELKTGDDGKKADGLDLVYATAWSYGWEELPNLMIPDFNGGSSSGAVNPGKSETIKLLKAGGQGNVREISKNLPLYWGPQPFTAGPMYMGAITIFLFLMGLLLYEGKEKWWIAIATVLAVLLAVGSHFIWFTKLFSSVAPLYNKFRTVSMALIILQFTLPVLGFLWLDSLRKEGIPSEKVVSKGWIAWALTGGVCLLCALFPGIAGTFTGPGDAGRQDVLVAALATDRKTLMVHDAWVGAILVSLAFAAIWWALRQGKKREYAFAFIGVLVLVNMFAVGKRYLGDDDFITPRSFNGQFAKRPVDEIILEDEALSYRTLDLSGNVFNDARSSYWHKEIGGYSPAKLQRYQDLIEKHITPEINSFYSAAAKASTIAEAEEAMPFLPVISMLNGKYLILGEDFPPVVNSAAFGNAWFVDSALVTASPDDEIAALSETDLRNVAVLGPDFKEFASAVEASVPAPGDTIYMTSYAANELHYHYRISSPRAVLFSEVYYPDGWHAWISGPDDGTVVSEASAGTGKAKNTDIEIFRADWILRGAVLPAGEHDLAMRFDPAVYARSSRISRASSILLFLLLLLSLLFMTRRSK